MADVLWTKEDIQEGLKTNDHWVVRGVLAIYDYQTEDEKNIEDTKHNNGVGFNGVDGHILSSFAVQIKKWENSGKKYRTPLSPKQMKLARKKIMKYAGQLTRIANGEM